MPATFQLNCPHCGTKSVGFELTDESWRPSDGDWHACARCNHCRGLVVLDLGDFADEKEPPRAYYEWQPDLFPIKRMYPSGAEIPAHLPEEVERFFRQGAENLPANPDAAGAMFRKTLEAVLRDRCPDAPGPLIKRIDRAAESGVLTPDLAHYAHTIRLEGNEAVHGAYDGEDARQLHTLVRLVLQYVYTLPGMQKLIDAEASAAAEQQAAASGET